MAKEIKFTKEELESIQNLQQKTNQLTANFGQLHIVRLNLEQQLEQSDDERYRLEEELKSLKDEEVDLIKTINEKYGAGTLDPTSGVFTPNQ
jgi:chromosome segregation ATPase